MSAGSILRGFRASHGGIIMKNTNIVRRNRKIRTSIMFMLPALVLYSVFVIFAILYSTVLGFTDWDGIGAKEFVGLENYIKLFGNEDFLLTLVNTLKVAVLSITFQVSIGLILAWLLFRTRSRIYKLYRAVYFLPVVIASTAIATMFRIILNNDIGVFSSLMETVGLGGLVRPWLSDEKVVLYAVIIVQIWQYIGTYVIIFLAALQSIDESILDSAGLDCRNSFQLFWHVVLPVIRPTLVTTIVLCFTGSMKSFDIPFIMTAGGPGYSSSYLGNYMYALIFSRRKFGRGSAVASIIMAVSLVFTVIFNKFTKEE